MRMIFGALSLVPVPAIAGFIANRQLKSAASGSSAGGISEVTPATTPARQSQLLQRQVKDDMSRALQQGAQRAASAAP